MKRLFYNGNVHTMESEKITNSFLVEGDEIIAVDCNVDDYLKDKECLCIDLMGKTIVPGFHDSHQHFLCYAIDKEKVDFFNSRSFDEMAQKVREYIDKHAIKKGEWIQGSGWNENNFETKQVPSREDLDILCPDNPVIFTRACCSVAIANTLALKEAGIFENPPQIDDGCIVVDDLGIPTGLLEERARFFVYDIIPNVNQSYLEQLILKYQTDLLETGLTTVQTDDFKLWDADYQSILNAYWTLDKALKLKPRFIQQVRLINMEELDSFLEKKLKTCDGSDHFKIGTYKLLPDGSLGGKTAALHEPYLGESDNCGILTYSEEEFYMLLKKAHDGGMQLSMHAIGDKTMDFVLDTYERISKESPKIDPRFRIIHCQITNEKIIERFANNNIIGDIQPLFIQADMDVAESLIGPERTKWSYNWKTMLDKGVRLSGSSDSPVEPFDPILAIYCAVTSKKTDGTPLEGWMPDQRLSRYEAVSLYTTGSAYSAYEENRLGKILPGFKADFLVLSNDIFTCSDEEILQIEVEKTFVGGECVYLRESNN